MFSRQIICFFAFAALALLIAPSGAVCADDSNYAVARVLRLGDGFKLSWRPISPEGLPKSQLELESLYSRVDRSFQARAKDIHGPNDKFNQQFGVLLRTYADNGVEKYEWTLLRIGGNDLFELTFSQLMQQRTSYRTIMDEFDLKSADRSVEVARASSGSASRPSSSASSKKGYRSITSNDDETLWEAMMRMDRNRILMAAGGSSSSVVRARLGASAFTVDETANPSLATARSLLSKLKSAASLKAAAKTTDSAPTKKPAPIIIPEPEPIESPSKMAPAVKETVEVVRKEAPWEPNWCEAIHVPDMVLPTSVLCKSPPMTSFTASAIARMRQQWAKERTPIKIVKAEPQIASEESGVETKIAQLEHNIAKILGYQGIDLETEVSLDKSGVGRFTLRLPSIEQPLLTGVIKDGTLSGLAKHRISNIEFQNAVNSLISSAAAASEKTSQAVSSAYIERNRIADLVDTTDSEAIRAGLTKADSLLEKAVQERNRLDTAYDTVRTLLAADKPKEAYKQASKLLSIKEDADSSRQEFVAQIDVLSAAISR